MAASTITAGLASSAGCRLKKPKGIQREAPQVSPPAPTASTTSSKTTTKAHSTLEALDLNARQGMTARVPITANATNPIAMKMAWRKRKYHELPCSLSASTDEAEYTMSRPNAQMATRQHTKTRRGRMMRAGTPAISFSPSSE